MADRSLHRLAGVLASPALCSVVLAVDAALLPVLPDRSGNDPITLKLNAAEAQRMAFWAKALDLDCQTQGETRHYHWPQSAGTITPDHLLALTQDIMALYGRISPETLAQRRNAMLVRAAGRVRTLAAPTTRRHRAQPGDIVVQDRNTPYSAFFAIEEYVLSWRQFNGSLGQPAHRAVFLSGDAVTVLPYDPVRDRVLLIDQFRPGPFARGDTQPWLLEPIAGRIDPGESPEQAARREAVEEAGLALTGLLPVAQYYPTPGANSEFLYSYVALTDLPDGLGGVFGLESEAEDIRTHVLPFAELMAMVTSGEAANAPLILTALWLERERPRLRAAKP